MRTCVKRSYTHLCGKGEKIGTGRRTRKKARCVNGRINQAPRDVHELVWMRMQGSWRWVGVRTPELYRVLVHARLLDLSWLLHPVTFLDQDSVTCDLRPASWPCSTSPSKLKRRYREYCRDEGCRYIPAYNSTTEFHITSEASIIGRGCPAASWNPSPMYIRSHYRWSR